MRALGTTILLVPFGALLLLGWGATRDARGTFGPGWDDARFELRGSRRLAFAIGY